MKEPTRKELKAENARLRAQIAFLQQFYPASFNGDWWQQKFLELLKRSLEDRELVAAARRALGCVLAGRSCDAARNSAYWRSCAGDAAFIARCRGYCRILDEFADCQTERFETCWKTLLDKAGKDVHLIPELGNILAELGMFARVLKKDGCSQPA